MRIEKIEKTQQMQIRGVMIHMNCDTPYLRYKKTDSHLQQNEIYCLWQKLQHYKKAG